MQHARCDVIVIGRGVIGATASWRAATAGLSVRCLDADPSGGASVIAAGMLAPVTEAEFGERQLLRLNLRSAARWPSFAAAVQRAGGVEIGYRRCGVLSIGYEHADQDQLGRLAALQRRSGLKVEDVSAAAARRREPMLGGRGAGGFWAPDDGQVDPRQLLVALAAAGRAGGVQLHRRHARELLRDDHGRVIGVVDEDGAEHLSDRVVLAAGHASGRLLAGTDIRVPTRPVKGQLIRLDGRLDGWPAEPRIVRGLVQQRPVYLVFRGHDHERGEVIVGATSEEWPDDRRVRAGAIHALLRDARAIMPGIDEFELVETCTAARPGTPDNLPIVGESGVPGLLIATGHYRNGILLSAVTADAFDDLFAGRPLDELWQPADPARFQDEQNGVRHERQRDRQRRTTTVASGASDR